MLPLKKWTEMGYVLKVPWFLPKTVDSTRDNCEFDHGSQHTFHFFRLLDSFAFVNIKSSSLSCL